MEYILIRHDEQTRELRRTALSEKPLDLNRSLWPKLKDGDWNGHRCFLVGGGPSLRGFDFERLRGEKVIAINAAFVDVPFADVLFMMDFVTFYTKLRQGKFGEKVKQLFYEFKGLKVILDIMNRHPEGLLYVPSTGRHGLSLNLKRGLCHGNNSGVGALNLAICLGADPIYLLGYDMKHKDGKAHYHNVYPVMHRETIHRSFAGDFEKIAPAIKELGVKVVNLSNDSALTCFPFASVERILPHDADYGRREAAEEAPGRC